MDLYKKYQSQFEKFKVNTPIRIVHFLAQIEHESNFKPISESLHYTSVGRVREIFKSPFKGKTDAFINGYLRNTIKMANYVYANRMGNGNESSGDGFKFRGRGFIQITGREMYQRLSLATGVSYITNPDLLLNEADSIISALWYFSVNGCNELADADNVLAITKKINGGNNGLADRKAKLLKWKKQYKIN